MPRSNERSRRSCTNDAPTPAPNLLNEGTMSSPAKRPGTFDHETPAKRRKIRNEEPKYTKRHITWEEQKTLPARFCEEKDVWPALRVLNERKNGVRKELLIEWEPHPITGEIFEPTWQPLSTVGAALRAEWERKRTLPPGTRPKPQRVQSEVTAPKQSQETEDRSQSAKPTSRRAQNRRVIQDSSSSQLQYELDNAINGLRTPTLVDSPASSIAASPSSDLFPIEIAETQEVRPDLNRTITVDIPATTINKADYESIRGSQISLHDPALGSSSPLEQEKAAFVAKTSSHITSSVQQNLDQSQSALVPASSSIEQTSSGTSRQAQLAPSPHIHEKQPSLDEHYLKDIIVDSQTSQRISQFESAAIQQSQPHSRQSTPNSATSSPRRSGRRVVPNSRIINPSNITSLTESIFKSPTSQRQPLAREPGSDTSKMSSPNVRQSLRSRTGTPARGKDVGTANSTISTPLNERVRRTRSSQTPQRPVPAPASQAVPTLEVTRLSQNKRTRLHQIDADEDQSASMDVQSSSATSTVSNVGNNAPAPSTPTAASTTFDPTPGSSALPIQQSIEEEGPSSTDEQTSGSKTNSSQQSVENERLIPQVDGYVMPTLPILGPDEYAIALPAEGKVQSVYVDTIKAKRKSILRFLRRRDSVGSGNGSATRTIERNDMIELVQRLHDTVTHLDLGLPDFATQYSLPSQEHAAYANYAGSKFVFLGHLVDELKVVPCSLIIMAQSATVLDLIADYLRMKHVWVNRHDRSNPADSQMSGSNTSELEVELICTGSDTQIMTKRVPVLMIAFDVSFDPQELRTLTVREEHTTGSGRLLPVIHLLVANSSEHVDRCIPKSTPSPSHLKLLVRATIQAQAHLGGAPTYVPDESDAPAEGEVMTYSDLQRAIRKSPNRKLSLIASMVAGAARSGDFDASYTSNPMPELQLDDIDLTPSKQSGTSSPSKGRQAASPTSVSRTGTPLRKRQLDVDGLSSTLVKRQRLTPVPDRPSPSTSELHTQIEHLHQKIKAMQPELQTERGLRESAEQQTTEWQNAHATLQRRYEKRMQKSHTLDKTIKTLLQQVEVHNKRTERSIEENAALKDTISDLKKQLRQAEELCRQGEPALAEWERAHEEARNYALRCAVLERSLESTKKDFEFTRQQYQDASTKAVELAGQVRQLESDVTKLTTKASGETMRLKQLNFAREFGQHVKKIEQLELEKKSRETLIRKMEEEIKVLRRTRTGVQTRGNSVQPPGSPGPAAMGSRSRGGSPAPGSGLLSVARAHEGVGAGGLRGAGSGLRFEQ